MSEQDKITMSAQLVYYNGYKDGLNRAAEISESMTHTIQGPWSALETKEMFEERCRAAREIAKAIRIEAGK